MKFDTSIFKTLHFWIVALLFVYALTGFQLIPHIIKTQTQKYVKTELAHDLSIESICLNPFTFEVGINGLKLSKNNESIVSFKNLNIDLEIINSIIEKRIDFKELSLTGPSLNIIQKNDYNATKNLDRNNERLSS